MVERVRVGTRDLNEPEQMGLLCRFPPRSKSVQRDQRDKIAPLRLAKQTDRQLQQTKCGHRLLSVVPIVSVRVEGGYAARCLLCGMTGPVRRSEQAARGVLSEEQVTLN
jgi:hypothetical protein